MSTALSVNAILFAGCLVHQPLTTCMPIRKRISLSAYPGVSQIHTFGEMIQMIEVLRGQKQIPEPCRRLLCRMPPRLGPVPNAGHFRDIDVALIEPSSPVEVLFRGYNINRVGIFRHILTPVHALGKDATRCAHRWFRLGLMEMDEKVREETTPVLLDYLPKDLEIGVDLARDVILEVRAERADIRDGFLRMQQLIHRPIGVVTYNFKYLEDGRVISWPAGFKEEVVSVAKSLGLPVFDPCKLVREFGVGRALLADQGHYTEAFLPTIADALATFAESIAQGDIAR